MISRRTWALLAATVIALVASLFYLDERPRPLPHKPPPDEVTWGDLAGPTAYEVWIRVGEFCGIATAVSVVADVIIKRRKRT